jgi:hypothetical protein
MYYFTTPSTVAAADGVFSQGDKGLRLAHTLHWNHKVLACSSAPILTPCCPEQAFRLADAMHVIAAVAIARGGLAMLSPDAAPARATAAAAADTLMHTG